MAPLLIVGLAIVIGMIVLPGLWVQYAINKHHAERSDFPGTGGELARHLIEHYELDGVTLEATEKGDHYDPDDRAVRLSEKVFNGRSVSAVAIAAHEVGHAIQHHAGDRMLALRYRLVKSISGIDKLGSIFFIAAPFLALLAKSPIALIVCLMIGIGILSIRVLVHLITLPVEYDASFGKAMKILEKGGYLEGDDLGKARHVLHAAALTYVSAAAASLLDIARWIRFFR